MNLYHFTTRDGREFLIQGDAVEIDEVERTATVTYGEGDAHWKLSGSVTDYLALIVEAVK